MSTNIGACLKPPDRIHGSDVHVARVHESLGEFSMNTILNGNSNLSSAKNFEIFSLVDKYIKMTGRFSDSST